MYAIELKLNALYTAYLHRLVNDIPDERLAQQPHAGMNHPAWILGHLAVAYDFAANYLGLQTELKRWYSKFAPGSTPIPDRANYPSKEELIGKLAAAGDRVRSAIATADLSLLAEPHSFDPVRPFLESKGDMLSYILSTHFSGHLGQLSTWRRTVGMNTV